jgi:hypothetical protein
VCLSFLFSDVLFLCVCVCDCCIYIYMCVYI